MFNLIFGVMSHEISTEKNSKGDLMVVGQPAWHGLGTVLDKPATAEEALKVSGLDFTVEKKKLFYGVEGISGMFEADNKFATIRTDTNAFLGVVGQHYTVLQNTEAFGFFDALVDQDEAIYHTAGVLGKGERVWILAKLPDYIKVGKDDLIEQYVLIHNSHDASSGLVACVTPVRVVCNNTLTAALRTATNKVTLRHTANVKERLEQAHELLGISNLYKQEMEQVFNQMAKKQFKAEHLQHYVDSIYPVDPNAEVQQFTLLGKKAKEKIVELFETGVGQDTKTAKGTMFGAYNAVTYFLDHERKFKSAETKLNSTWFGDAQTIRQKAFDAALAMF